MTSSPDALTVAVAQPLVVPGEVATNLQRMRPLVTEAAGRGARLVVFSECALTGYDHCGRAIDAAIAGDDPAIDAVADMAAEHDLAIITGFYERAGDAIHNTAVAVRPDGSRVYQRKHHIIGYEAEHTAVRPGPRRRERFDWCSQRIAMLICADSGIPNIHRELADAGFTTLVAPTAGVGDADKGYHLADLADGDRRQACLDATESVCFSRQALERCLTLGVNLVAVNQAGYEPTMGYFHPGHSMIVSRTGRLEALIPGRFIFEHLRPELAVGTLPPPTD